METVSARTTLIPLLILFLVCSPAVITITKKTCTSCKKVTAVAETYPVSSTGDAADDICIWVDSLHPEQSRIIGTDKNDSSGSLTIFDLSGKALYTEPVPDANNVDLRNGFPFYPDSTVPLVVTDRAMDSAVLFFRLRQEPPLLQRLTVDGAIGIVPYGICFYVSAASGRWYVFVTERTGTVVQALIEPAGENRVSLTTVRTIRLGSICEGCVTDDVHGSVFIAEENRGIWRFGAEPDDDSTNGLLIDSIASGRITADIEGLTLYLPVKNHSGFLLASIQGGSFYAVYDWIPPYTYRGCFSIEKGNGIDRVTETDGIDVTSFPLGQDFPEGVFIAQDDRDDTGTQNFKIVSWKKIRIGLGL
jgi:3-phytase